MRVVLFTGKGGVGKTTVAAATAARAAAGGRKTLVLSTDGAHSLGDALDVRLGAEPTEIGTGLYGLQVDTTAALQRSWYDVSSYLRALLEAAGVESVAAEELTVLPGAEELLALAAVREHAASGLWDVVVVDCAPTAETLRLLALPEALGWYLRRFVRHRAARTPLFRPAGLPVPQERVYPAVERLAAELAGVRALLTDPAVASVRLVLTPERVVLAETRRALTTLALHGYPVDAVVANRVLPAGGDPWRDGWARAQEAVLAEADFGALRLRRAAYLPAEPVGLPALIELAAAVYGDDDPVGPGGEDPSMRVERDGEEYTLALALPHTDREEIELLRSGDDLVLTAGSARRVLALPSVLRRCDVVGARLVEGQLRVQFRPDPALWRSL